MKNIVYFVLTATFLFSCKGSSFLKQRYTHLGHSSSKKTVVAQKHAAPHKSETSVNPAPANARVAEVNSGQKNVTADKNLQASPEEQALVQKTKTKKIDKLYSQLDVFHLSNKKETGVSTKKINPEKKNFIAAAGAVGKVLKIIILLLVLAIILGLIYLVQTIKA